MFKLDPVRSSTAGQKIRKKLVMKTSNGIDKKAKQAGMSIVELLVVLSIFSVVSSVAIFNFGNFQSQIDIKNLASDIALKTVEAQKASLSGLLPPLSQQAQIDETWKPSYGVYFSTTPNNSFIYFTDLKNPTQNSLYDVSSCPGTGECLEQITITKGNVVSGLDVFYQSNPSTAVPVENLAITFVRPNSSAIIASGSSKLVSVSYVRITITSPKATTSAIKVYPSGRIQIN